MTPAQQEDLDLLVQLLAKIRYYAEVDPAVTLPLARRAAERVCRRILVAASVSPGNSTLKPLIDVVCKRDLARPHVIAALLTIQGYGNYGSHDQDEIDRVDTRYVTPCVQALEQLVEWYAAEHFGEREALRRAAVIERTIRGERASTPRLAARDGEALRIGSVRDVIDWGWSGETLLDHLIALDFATIDGLDDASEGHTAQWAPVFMEHPDTWRLLVAGPGQIVGYWHFVPLSPADYALARAGRLLDGTITSDRVELFELAGDYDVYFVSITLHERHRGVVGLNLLLGALLDQMTFLAHQGIYLSRACANAFTTVGEKLCQAMGMSRIGRHADFGTIYETELVPLPRSRLFDRYPELLRLYRDHRRG